MLSKYDLIGFLAVRDLARAEEFYVGKLGLERVGNDGFALVLRANGNMIRVVKTENEPLPFTVLGWEVPEIASAAMALKAAGINLKRYGYVEQDVMGVWTAPDGSKVLWFEDPDGNVLSLSEHAGVVA